jgi:hypothetical protein
MPGRIRPAIAGLKADTAKAVADMVAAFQASDDDTLITYRNDDEYKAAGGRLWEWTASWHRQVCAQAAQQTGARIDYADIDEDDE